MKLFPVLAELLIESKPVKAVDSGKRSPLTGKPIFNILDSEGKVLQIIHVAKTSEEALQIVLELPAKQAASKLYEPKYDVLTSAAKKKEPRSLWKIFTGKTDRSDGSDDYYYHITSHKNAKSIIRDGLIPDSDKAFTPAYAAHSKGRVFFTDRDGVNYWCERVEQKLFHGSDKPSAVAVLRIPKSAIKNVEQDEIGSTDARAAAYYVKGKLV